MNRKNDSGKNDLSSSNQKKINKLNFIIPAIDIIDGKCVRLSQGDYAQTKIYNEHPLEVALGLGLYVASIFVLSRFMGEFHVATIVITWIAFSEINLHNHDRWTSDRFPFRYINTMAVMHHHHHAMFTGGNFATISLLYDWMFGTLDHGEGGKSGRKRKS